ncbi:MAG: hypothetical protein QOH73_1101 [Gaiellaceae bacterium]|nr:hypothetical protein [Gaiellaceae bacterium]
MNVLARFGRFWWDFVVGDDWLVAAGVVAGLGGTALLVHYGVSAWWLMPVVVVALLGVSLRRAVRS